MKHCRMLLGLINGEQKGNTPPDNGGQKRGDSPLKLPFAQTLQVFFLILGGRLETAIATHFTPAGLGRVVKPRRAAEEPSSRFQPPQFAQAVWYH